MTFNFIIFFLFAAVGVGLMVWTLAQTFDAIGSKRWGHTSGIIEASRVEDKLDEGTVYRAYVRYAYTVHGQRLIGRRTQFGDEGWISPRVIAARQAHKYRVGSTVTVHFNPHNPSEAVLTPGFSLFLAIDMLAAVVFVALGILGAAAV